MRLKSHSLGFRRGVAAAVGDGGAAAEGGWGEGVGGDGAGGGTEHPAAGVVGGLEEKRKVAHRCHP